MAFINEYITAEDLVKYDIEAFYLKYVVGGTRPSQWTIDRERSVYLINVARGREEYFNETTWILFFENQLIEFGINYLDCQESDSGVTTERKKLRHLNLPAQMIKRRDDVISVIRQALTAYKDGGVLSQSDKYTLVLEA